jgi:hypothetical protein
MSKRPSTTDRHPSVTESADGDAFLSRWARRKALARSGGDPDAGHDESAVDAGAEAAPPSMDSAPVVTDAHANDLANDLAPEPGDEDMPPLESIDEHTDMRGFFSSKVSQAVKKAALKKFFHSPAFNIVDGLDDYDDDFRNFEALGDIITSDMRSQMDREAEAAREKTANVDQERGSPESAETAASDELGGAQAGDEPAARDVAEVQDADEASSASAPADAEEDDADGKASQARITRESGAQTRIAHGKLRPRDAGGEDA